MSTIRLYVIDTSYLLELFHVDGYSEENGFANVKNKVGEAIKNNYSFYIPIPVLFELANHIADVRDFSRRRALAKQLSEKVLSWLDDKSIYWVLTPPGNAKNINELMEAIKESANRFSNEFSNQQLGLTDTIVILEAERLKNNYPSNTLKQ
ncbi:MAG: hypothetical protein NTX45_23700 [Proteobacteria bacterium]|nr:hypothetical protein [Pseudomonadota bacterium]